MKYKVLFHAFALMYHGENQISVIFYFSCARGSKIQLSTLTSELIYLFYLEDQILVIIFGTFGILSNMPLNCLFFCLLNLLIAFSIFSVLYLCLPFFY